VPTQAAEILIGNVGADHVSISVGKADREGWRSGEIAVHCDGWSGRIAGSFLKGDLQRFADGVRALGRNLVGTARLDPVEPNITLILNGDGKGHVVVNGVARNSLHLGTRLEFRFEIDRTYLDHIANALRVADQ